MKKWGTEKEASCPQSHSTDLNSGNLTVKFVLLISTLRRRPTHPLQKTYRHTVLQKEAQLKNVSLSEARVSVFFDSVREIFLYKVKQ